MRGRRNREKIDNEKQEKEVHIPLGRMTKAKKEALRNGYLETAHLLRQRCEWIRFLGLRRDDNKLGHDIGTLKDYENDIMYCGYMAKTLHPEEAENKADASQRKGWSLELFDPEKMAEEEEKACNDGKAFNLLAWTDAPSIPDPDETLKEFMARPYLRKFTKREREILLLWQVCSLTVEDIADRLRIGTGTVNNTLSAIRKKCKGEVRTRNEW